MSEPIIVLNPRRLPQWQIPAERIPLNVPGDYKPNLALLPDGELVLVAFFGEDPSGRRFCERTALWRSDDGGRTWAQRTILADVIGREQYITATRDGTLFLTCHLLVSDVNNTEDVSHSYVHRSTDRGRTWQRTRVLIEGDERRGEPMQAGTGGATSRNVVEMEDGTLLLGVSVGDSGVAYLWSSSDVGETWEHGEPVSIGDYNGKPYANYDGFFAEDFTYLAGDGRLLHWIRCGPPSPMYPLTDGRVAPERDDQGDRSMICESTDGGRSWVNLRDFGDYGMMYVRVTRLRDGRLLLTYTQRSTFPPLGLRAMFSRDDGRTWDFDGDILILEGKTPCGLASGGGFGNTVQLDDDTLVSTYSYRGADNGIHAEVVRWALP